MSSLVFGLESASDKVLKLMRKSVTVADASATLTACREAGIRATMNIIVGYPGETFADFLETVLFVVRHKDMISGPVSGMPCNASPGTDLYECPEKFDIRIDSVSSRGIDTMKWVSVDGTNTYEERTRRKEILDFVAQQILWPKTKSGVASPLRSKFESSGSGSDGLPTQGGNCL